MIQCEIKLLIHSQTSTVQLLKFGNGKVISFDTLLACDYLSMLGLKLIYASVSIRGPRSWTSSTWFQPFTADPVVGKCQRTHLTGQGESLACARHKALFKINLPLVPHICVSESKQMLGYCQLGPWEQTSVKFESIYNFFIHENAFENIVCEMAAILSRGR